MAKYAAMVPQRVMSVMDGIKAYTASVVDGLALSEIQILNVLMYDSNHLGIQVCLYNSDSAVTWTLFRRKYCACQLKCVWITLYSATARTLLLLPIGPSYQDTPV